MVHCIQKNKEHSREEAVIAAFKEKSGAAGFYSRKVTNNGERIGYDLVDLATGEALALAREPQRLPENWEEALVHGHFSFSKAGFAAAERIVTEALEAGVSTIFIDEAGKLELQEEGYAPLIRTAVEAGVELYLGCRRINAKPLEKLFSPKK